MTMTKNNASEGATVTASPPPDSNKRLSVTEAAKLRQVSPKTMDHWIRDGIRTPNGRVRLKAPKLGGRRFTTLAYLEAFEAALNPDDNDDPMPTAAEMRRRDAEADASLKELGINLDEPMPTPTKRGRPSKK